MAYDEGLAARIEAVLYGQRGIETKKMFGGLCFLLNGNMLCGIAGGDDLMLRVGPEQYGQVLAMEGAREMDFTGRAMKGMIYVDTAFAEEEAPLAAWIELALNFVKPLPAKKPKPRK